MYQTSQTFRRRDEQSQTKEQKNVSDEKKDHLKLLQMLHRGHIYSHKRPVPRDIVLAAHECHFHTLRSHYKSLFFVVM